MNELCTTGGPLASDSEWTVQFGLMSMVRDHSIHDDWIHWQKCATVQQHRISLIVCVIVRPSFVANQYDNIVSFYIYLLNHLLLE